MKANPVRRLRGMQDLAGRHNRLRSLATESFSTYLAGNGYEPIDTPLLEEAELFVRKAGGELTSRLYAFIDPGGGRVSLRPEFTSSVIRHFIEEGESLALPVRWRYAGPVFRYEQQEGAHHQFTQLGAEVIGASGFEADVEVLSVAWLTLYEVGLRGHQMRIGNLGLIHELLSGYGLSEAARFFVISNVRALRDAGANEDGLMDQAEALGLLRPRSLLAEGTDGSDIGPDLTHEAVKGVFAGELPEPYGRRTPDQVVERLLRKAREADDPKSLQQALSLVAELAQVNGSPESALKRARRVLGERGLKLDAMNDAERTIAGLLERGIDARHLTVDFGLAPGISYYTGVIFDVFDSARPGQAPLGSGGRYDGLVQALGGDEVAAIGFAFRLDRLVEALEGQGSATAGRSGQSQATGRQSAASRGS